MKRAGTTILFVSHSTEQVKRFCDRALWIDQGELREIGDVAAVCDRYESYSLGRADAQADALVSGMMRSDIERAEGGVEGADNSASSENSAEVEGHTPAKLRSILVDKNVLTVFDEFKVELSYDVLDEKVESLLVGVAIRRAGDDLYLFGPNTGLDNILIPNDRGSYSIDYVIPRLQLLPGDYYVDAGIFSDKGLVCLDYRSKVQHFCVQADYFAEGVVYLDHQWVIRDEPRKTTS